MKRFLLILISLFISVQVFAEGDLNTVLLDLNGNEVQKYNKSPLKIEELNMNKEKEDDEDYIYRPMEYVKNEARELYSSKTLTQKKEKKFGKATVGAKNDATFSPDSLKQKNTLYSKYDINEKLSVEADYQTNSQGMTSPQTKGTVGIGPEYKLNKKVKLKQKISKDFSNNSNKGEVSVEYKPFSDDKIDFNAGAAEIQQDDGTGAHSQINFGTNIRF